jgi:phosphoglycerate kinase
MKSVRSANNLKGKRALVRVDFNLPVKNGKIEDAFRIEKALPTIKFLQNKGAKVILMTHFGKGGDTLAPVARILHKYVKSTFVPEVVGAKVTEAVAKMKNGDVVLLENLRNDPGEQGADKIFAMNLAKLADIYVNEAFPVSHREDASIVLVPKLLPSYAGLQLMEEINNLSHAFDKPKHPFLFILGGAKFSTKMPLIEKYLKLADYVFIGGALANDFFKAKGYEVGKSLVSEESYGIKELLKNKKLILPDYVVVKEGSRFVNKGVAEVTKDEVILDVGTRSEEKLAPIIKKAKIILWNGPLGKYEVGAGQSTREILELVAKSKAESIIGGGDTVALISKLKIEKKFSFVSTGGGAALDFLANGTLPGIDALN